MKILVVEDDLALSDVIAFTLRRAGFAIVTAYDGLAALASWEAVQPDLVLLDLNLPHLDGLEVCRRIRTTAKTPIIMLSVRNSDEIVVKGLELGADDYIVKPFSPTQLVARVRAVLRRAGLVETPGQVTVGNVTLDRARNTLQRPNQLPIRLTQLEVRLLEVLLINQGQVLTSDQLINAVWGVDGGDRTMLKQLMYRLRTKLETDAAQPPLIETIAGVGYAFKAADDA
ncbi:MAG: response regulator transcription factor [Chloroflexota bacterium]|nr:response regulator transcription factor [Chloroflexota bacterium]